MDLLQPIFVIGSPRSGTSLLRIILTSHTKIVIPPECGFIVWLFEKYKNWTTCNTTDRLLLKKYLDDLYACKKFDTWGLERDFLEATILNQEPEDYASLSATIVSAFALKHGTMPLIWGDKNNFHTDSLPVLDLLYPRARFLHIVRDGRDVACSYREVMERGSSSPYAPRFVDDIEEIAAEWSANVLRVESYLTGVAEPRRHLVRYEDLVQGPKEVVSSICRWIGVAYEDNMLDSHELNRSQKLEPSLTLDWKKRTLEPISATTVGRYKEILSTNEEACFIRLAGRALSKFGYIS